MAIQTDEARESRLARILPRQRRRDLITIAIIAAGVLLLWELSAWLLSGTDTALAAKKLPYPHSVAAAFVTNWPDLWDALRVTALGAAIGLGVGTTIGVAIALIAGQSRLWESALYPYVVVGQMVPTIALAPILLAIIRDVDITRIVVASYITFFPISLNMLKGLRSISQSGTDLMSTYNASRFQSLRKLRLPEAAPFFFTGFKIAAPLCVVAEIVVELSGATSGIGYLILITQYYGPGFADFFWSAVVAALFLGVLFFRTAVWLERIVTPWQPEFRA